MHVLLEQETLTRQPPCRSSDLPDVASVTAVKLLQRGPWVTRGHPLLAPSVKRDHHPKGRTHQIPVGELWRAQVPTRESRYWRVEERVAYTGDVVANLIHLGHQDTVHAEDLRDQLVDHASIATDARTEVELARCVEQAIIGDGGPGGAGGNVRKPRALLVRGRQGTVVDARHAAVGWRRSIVNPFVQRRYQRAVKGTRVDWI